MLCTRITEQRSDANLQVISPLIHAIALRDLWLEQGHMGHRCGQTGDGLAPAASHSYEQGISTGLL